jgi:uncharacterized protein YneF (UPF0154 family)
MIIDLAVLLGWVALTILVILGVRVVRRVLYIRSVRHLPRVTEWQARKNAAPLTNAFVNRYAADE